MKSSLAIPSAVAAPTLQARKHELVRDAIWDAAIHLFSGKGFDETTVEDIATRAGVSRRSFFRYFSSKSDLMAQGVVSYGDDLTAVIDGLPSSYPLSSVFRETVLQIARQSAAHPRTVKIMEIAARYPAARAAQLSRMAEVQDHVAAAFARRLDRGSEGDLAPGILAGLTLSVLAVTFRSWFDQGQPEIAEVAGQVLATLGCLISAGRLTGSD